MERIETLREFEERYNDIFINGGKDFRVSCDYIYKTYYSKIYPYKHLITKHQVTNGITIPEICVSFGVSQNTFNACRYYFSELDELVKHKRDIMKIKSEMDLQRGIEDSPSNPKLLEMQFRLYNDEWRDKGADVEVNLPTELTVVFEDASLSDDELDDIRPRIDGQDN